MPNQTIPLNVPLELATTVASALRMKAEFVQHEATFEKLQKMADELLEALQEAGLR